MDADAFYNPLAHGVAISHYCNGLLLRADVSSHGVNGRHVSRDLT
ncbi:hypothetical protein CCP3SC1AL1_100006 [Gammaproteobacteria bacterium]